MIKIESDDLNEALRVISRLSPPVSGNIEISVRGKKIFLKSNGETSRCVINCPGSVNGEDTSFAVAMQSLKDAIKGRKTLEIDFDKAMCKIRSGAYRCDLPTYDVIEIDYDKEKKDSPIKISGEEATWLRQAAATVALKPTPLIPTFMPLAVRLTAKGAFVSCYDVNHMAYVHNKELQGDIQIKLPLDTFTSVLEAFNKGGFTLELSESTLYVSNQLVKVALQLPQSDANELKIEEVLDVVKSSKSAKGEDLIASKSDILNFLDNARAVATKERSEIRISADDKLKLEVLTANGSTKALIKASGKGQATIDFEYFDEAVRKSGDQVVMKLVKSEFIAFQLKVGTAVVAVNQS